MTNDQLLEYLNQPIGYFDLSLSRNVAEVWVILNASRKNSHIYCYYEKINDKYIGRYYYVKFRNGEPYRTYPIAIKIENSEEFLMKDGIYCGASGWFVNDNWYSQEWYKTKQRFSPFAHTNYEDIIEVVKNDESLKYASVELKGYIDLLTYIGEYRQQPKLEILAKWGYPQLITCKRFLNFEGHTWQQVTKIPESWKCKIDALGLPALQSYYKKGFSFETIDKIQTLKEKLRGCYGKLKLKKEGQIRRLYYYVLQLGYLELNLLKDYYNYAYDLKKDLQDNYWLTPKDLKEMHDKLVVEDKLKKDAELDSKYKTFDEGISKTKENHNFDKKEGIFELFTANNTDIIRKNGDLLSICVGSLSQHYIENMSKNGNVIVFGYVNNKLECCIEVDWKNEKLLQVRAEHNSICEYKEDFQRMIFA